jgi:transposase-like protein
VSRSRPYRMHRKLNLGEQAELVELYGAGASMVELAEKFECHRQTIARQLKKAGVTLREQQVRSPDFDQRARTLYEQGNALDEVADILGVQASTINRAVRGAGGTLRPQRRRSRDE